MFLSRNTRSTKALSDYFALAESQPTSATLHFNMKCSQYDQLRSEMFAQIQAVEFFQMNDDAKFNFLLTTQSVAKVVAQFIVNAFDARLSQL